ncbi:Expansin-A11 [Auxenochlorella protothecoides]|uniref:Expansin-A11 n=1 Tax=Auxenochlorella protothecoides TaxID=3075 RepID=A0A087SCZ2_AUXPR|nr:Expansin-A11 [Auxenochlorella protothecoides]KFM23596.1 Expansin-A11 [Auxenochlorella protothecoides]
MAVLAVALLAAPVGAVKAITDWEDAFITHYGGSQDGMDPSSPSFGTSEGACGYGSISKDAYPYFSVAAFSPSNHYYQSDALKACGQCFQIQCEEGRNGKTGVCKTDAQGEPLSILVMISDVCPECEANHIDVQSLAFGKLADQGLGNIDVRYRRVECAVPENMKVSVMNYDGAGQWLRLSIDDTGGYAAVKSVSVKSSSSSSWTTMSNTWGAVWEDGSAPQPPLDFQIECADGQVVSADSVVKQNGGISGGVGGAISFSTSVQFAITDPAASARKDWGQCSQSWLTSGSYCQATCGSCGSSASGSSPASSSSPSTSGSSDCQDTPPSGGSTCEQQLQWGACSQGWMTSGNYCAATCGRCGSGASTSPAQVSSYSGPAGRRLLRA